MGVPYPMVKEAVGMVSKLQEEQFARICARTGELLEAARRLGLSEEAALDLAQKPRVCDSIEKHEKALENGTRSYAVRALLRLATYSGNDGVKLAVCGDRLSREELDRLDFVGVSSFKYTPEGVCEIKFFDQVRAAQLLLELGEEKGNGAEGFYQALRESAALLGDGEAGQEAGEDNAEG